MYAALHLQNSQTAPGRLLNLALQFSPTVEQTRPDTVVFSIDPLRKLIGPPQQIASEISRYGFEEKLQANLAIASNPDAAILLACHVRGVTLITPGDERFAIAPLPLPALLTHTSTADPGLLPILHRWGIKTCGELAQLPENGLAERLGQTGVMLRKLALGMVQRPLQVVAPSLPYEERVELEHPLDLLEPLLFLLGRVLGDFCGRLRSQSCAVRLLKANLELDGRAAYACKLEFPVPLVDSKTLLKLLQLHLERHPPGAAVTAFTLQLEPVAPKRLQDDFFLPPTPAPDKLQVTLSRIASMVGPENVGSPRLLNTYRPDAFELVPLDLLADRDASAIPKPDAVLRLSMRLFRPALCARVELSGAAPQNVAAPGVKGAVLRAAGPWKTSGEWWAASAWIHEEWDVALDDGALYRIFQDTQAHRWFVQGVYD